MSVLLVAVVASTVWLVNDRVHGVIEDAARERLEGAGQRLAATLAESGSQFSREVQETASDPVIIAAAAGRGSRDPARLARTLSRRHGNSNGTVSRALWSADCTLVAATGPSRGRAHCPDSAARASPHAVGPFGSRGDTIDYRLTAAVRGAAGDTIGYVVGVRILSGSGAEAIEQLIGHGATFVVGNASGSLWTDFARPVSGPAAPTPGGTAVQLTERDGERELSVMVPVPGTPWMVLLRLPHSAVVAPARELLASVAAVALLCVMLGTVGAWLISRRVTRPIDEIAAAATGVAAGDYSRRVPVRRHDELGQLAATFNSMAARVETASNDLHAQALELEEQVQEARDARRDTAVVRSLLDDVLSSAPVGIAVFDRHLRFVKTNAAMAAINGYPAEMQIGNTPSQVDGGVGAALEPLLIEARTAGETLAHRRVSVPGPDGGMRHWLVTAFPVRDVAGELTSVGAVVLDITAQQDLEAQLLQSQKMEAVGRLAGGVAHDFNNLLTVILSYSSMAAEALPPGDELRGDMEEIRDAANRAAALTKQLLAFSRNQVMQAQVMNINDTARGMERLLHRLIGEDVELVLDLAPDLADVSADPGQMEQVIMNLVVNARDAMPEGGRIVIATCNRTSTAEHSLDATREGGKACGEHVVLSVADTGTGMTPVTREHLFEPFYTTKPAGKGTGLGLSTVYGIVTQSGGDVHVQSEEGRGTTFSIRLPRTVADQPPRRRSPGGMELPGVGTVMLVEDDPALRTLARRMLEQAGYTVLEAASGEAAITTSRAFEGEIDLLLTDVVMPGQNGRVVAERLRRQRPRLRVLFMSGYTDDEVVRRGVSAESSRFLQKPFTPTQLGRAVREALQREPDTLEA